MLYKCVVVISIILTTVFGTTENNEVDTCNLSEDLIQEIASYGPIVEKILNTAINGSFKGRTYNELALFVDKFGNRLAGTTNLENAIDYMLNKSEVANLDNVHGEEVPIPHWIRGDESASLIEPRTKPFSILGLGNSVGTPPEGILAEALIVKSFDDLNAKSEQAKGKIVVFNQDWKGYGQTVQYRGQGATAAAKVGAVASLIRSITDFSLNTPHTGMQTYGPNVTKIPTACITLEDANLLQRLQDEGQTIKIFLKMGAQTLPDVTSRNTVFELQGTKYPEKVVVISGHLDSWDVGEGAMDDGGGAFISWAALALLKSLDLKPKRTLRGILWTGEEFGYVGASGYKKTHANESENFTLFMESDIGTFEPLGIEYTANKEGGCILQEIVKLLAPINATQATASASVGSDIELWEEDGFPGVSLNTKRDTYFWYHHTRADTMAAENPENLDKNTGLWAAVAYVIADLSIEFPKTIQSTKH